MKFEVRNKANFPTGPVGTGPGGRGDWGLVQTKPIRSGRDGVTGPLCKTKPIRPGKTSGGTPNPRRAEGQLCKTNSISRLGSILGNSLSGQNRPTWHGRLAHAASAERRCHGADREIGVPGGPPCQTKPIPTRLRMRGRTRVAWAWGPQRRIPRGGSPANPCSIGGTPMPRCRSGDRRSRRATGQNEANFAEAPACKTEPICLMEDVGRDAQPTKSRGRTPKQTQFGLSGSRSQMLDEKRVMMNLTTTVTRKNKANFPPRRADAGRQAWACRRRDQRPNKPNLDRPGWCHGSLVQNEANFGESIDRRDIHRSSGEAIGKLRGLCLPLPPVVRNKANRTGQSGGLLLTNRVATGTIGMIGNWCPGHIAELHRGLGSIGRKERSRTRYAGDVLPSRQIPPGRGILGVQPKIRVATIRIQLRKEAVR